MLQILVKHCGADHCGTLWCIVYNGDNCGTDNCGGVSTGTVLRNLPMGVYWIQVEYDREPIPGLVFDHNK